MARPGTRPRSGAPGHVIAHAKNVIRVVVADDEASVRSALRLLLEQDLRITSICDVAAAECLQRHAESSQPDVVLLDWELPGLDAPHLLAALRALPSHPRLIALSSRPEQRRCALAGGVDAFVCKGDAPEQLLATLRQYLGDGARESATA